MNTHFTLKEIFNVYHDKCNELDLIQNINDKLIEQNEKLINTNIMYSNEIQELKKQKDDLRKNRNIHLNRKLKLYDERKVLNSIIDTQQDEIQELKGIVSREMKKNRGLNNYYKNLTKNKETFIDRWDDYNHG